MGKDNNILDKLPMSSKLSVYYTSCKASEDFSDKMIEFLKGILKPNKKEEIIIDIYRSIHCWIKTIIVLNNTIHVQAVASATRSIYEQLLDLKLIVDDKIDNAIEKFEAFREVETFRIAKKFADFTKEHPAVKIRPHEKRIKYGSNISIQEKIDKLKAEWWGTSKGSIEHWSGYKINKRAELAGIDYEILYNESFNMLSWYVHAGQVGARRRSKEFLELVYGDSMRLIHEMFVDAVLLVARALKITSAIPEFSEWIKQLELVPGFAILEEEKKFLDMTKN